MSKMDYSSSLEIGKNSFIERLVLNIMRLMHVPSYVLG